MAFNVKTIIKIFMIFFFFQLTLNFIIEVSPILKPTFTSDDTTYLNFLIAETNIISGEEQGSSLLTEFSNSLQTEGLFNDGIIESFLGVFKIIGQIILFIVEIALLLLLTPSIFMNILLYNFIGSSVLITSISLIINISFYMIMFYIIFKARTQN